MQEDSTRKRFQLVSLYKKKARKKKEQRRIKLQIKEGGRKIKKNVDDRFFNRGINLAKEKRYF